MSSKKYRRTKDYIKANRKANREYELENEEGFKSIRKIHSSKKNYKRKLKYPLNYEEEI